MKSQQDFDKKLIEIELALPLDSKPEITRARRLLRPKTMAYWTDIFPHLNDESEYNNFKSHFRILRSTFNQLLSILHQHPNYASTPFQPQIPLEIQVGVVIQRFANPMGYRQLEQMFGISQGSVAHFTKRFIEAVLDTLQHVIHWPDSERFQQVIEGFAPPEFGQRISNVVWSLLMEPTFLFSVRERSFINDT